MESNGIYYLAREASQFTSIAPLWQKLGGKFLTWRIHKNRVGTPYPFRIWKNLLFPKIRDLQDFHQQISILFPGSESGTIRHFYLGPFPKDTEVMICTSMWPIPARSERDFTTFQFYHGVGDKRYKVGGVKNEFPPMFDHWDYWMLPGEKDKQKLLNACQEYGIVLRPDQLVEIGYLRFDKIINKQYDTAALLQQAGIPDNGRKNILFAPTWKWGGGTLMSHYQVFCELIPRQYNLIIRNHINDNRNIQIVRDYCREKQIQNVYFINDTVMNITDNIIFADLLISDSSSVVYDFLIMDRPLVFNKINSVDVMPSEKRFDIKRCGVEFDIEKDNILAVLEHSFITDEYKPAIAEVRQNCFYHLDGRATERAADFIRARRKLSIYS
jgi:hypothetical protein